MSPSKYSLKSSGDRLGQPAGTDASSAIFVGGCQGEVTDARVVRHSRGDAPASSKNISVSVDDSTGPWITMLESSDTTVGMPNTPLLKVATRNRASLTKKNWVPVESAESNSRDPFRFGRVEARWEHAAARARH